ncbi:SseB family protein [Brevundimonas lenta]|uniref:SseB protein N-terminal domain-containing protein n=1 Tax=Brevundimonas lenta TaxID=424796 RepID=A0A7W6JDJ4_9CAUL|nr:SseB family protein [Brevundimonas lenta]MBB4083121.1 hypothetical protein [Brevundimonas lenta]
MANEHPLELAIASALKDPTRASGLEVALLSAELYVVPTDGVPAAGVELGRDRPLDLQGIVLKNGKQATAAFIRREGATVVFGAPASMGMRGQHLLEAFRNGWVVLNPGQEQGLVLSPEDIAIILGAAGAAQPAPEREDVTLSVPERTPDVLIARLKTVLTADGITAAWLARSTTRAGEKGWRLEVRGDRGLDDVRSRVAAAVDGLDFGGEPLDLVFAQGAGADAVGVKLV